VAWIELHQAVWTHRKTFELAALLDIDETYAAAHLIRLWTWSLDNAPDGDLSSVSDRALAYGSGWRGDATAFASALLGAGWLDDDRQIHDWDEYGGKLVNARAAERQRARNRRLSIVRPPDVLCTSGGQPAVGQQTAVGTIEEITREDITGQETTGEAASSEPPDGADAPSPLRCAALSPEQKSRADTFSQTLTGINGFQATPDFLVKVVTKYEAVDLEESALAIAGYAKKRPKWLTNAAILNWLRKDLERLNTPPPERTGRNGTDHGPMKQRAPTHAPISDEAREYVRSLGSGVPS
jgi:hypothetical protein